MCVCVREIERGCVSLSVCVRVLLEEVSLNGE